MLFSCVNPNIVARIKAELAREEQSLADLPIRQRGEQNLEVVVPLAENSVVDSQESKLLAHLGI